MNVFKIRRWSSIILTSVLSVVLFYIGIIYYGMFGGVGFFMVGLLLSLILCSVLLVDPFRAMVEGKGILCLNIDSTGVIQPFIVGLHSPFVIGRFKGNQVKDAYDRSSVMMFSPPPKVKSKATKNKEGGYDIKLNEDDFNKARFAMFQYPVLIWNDQIKSFLTKDFLSSFEKDTFAEHGVLYLNRKMEELTSLTRDFARHVIEQIKPVSALLKNKWFWIILLFALGILLLLFARPIFEQVTQGGGILGGLTNSGEAAVSTITPTP